MISAFLPDFTAFLPSTGPPLSDLQWLHSQMAKVEWDDAPILRRHGQEVATILGEEDGVLTVDGSDLLKPGQESVGVKRPYGGAVGQRANYPAGVFLDYASRHG